ncbi:Protein of unknown function [Frankineae bacterium MT45]|nr:Protein of unknown function [Frankineae bacterium MT45]
MAFRRREKRTELSKLDATPPWEIKQRDAPEPTTGPFDERDAPEDEITRIDLGALRVPIWPGVDVRLDVNEAQQVVFATLVADQSQMQIGVFAAPRSEQIWDEVRGEIADSLVAQGGSGSDSPDGPFGTELAATLVLPDGKTPARFIGVQGPRWFLRAMIVGPAATDREKAAVFEDAFAKIVVVRGNDPLPVREPVPLTLPKDVVAPQDADQA